MISSLPKRDEKSPKIDPVKPPVTEISAANKDKAKDKLASEVKVEKTQQNTSTKVKVPSKGTTIRSTQQKGIAELRKRPVLTKKQHCRKQFQSLMKKRLDHSLQTKGRIHPKTIEEA